MTAFTTDISSLVNQAPLWLATRTGTENTIVSLEGNRVLGRNACEPLLLESGLSRSIPEPGLLCLGPDVTSCVEALLLEMDIAGIAIAGFNRVRDYLLTHSDMVSLISSVSSSVLHAFNGNASFSFELYVDPEIDDEYLTLYIRQKSYDDSLMQTIDKLTARYQQAIAMVSGWLLITTDFAPPT